MSDISIDDVRRLDGGLLLVFRDVLRTGSATATAGRLGISQSAVSHALSRLRRIHQDPLFVRRPHGLEPTRRAVELGPLVDAVLESTAALFGQGAVFDPATSERHVTLAAPEFVVATIGGPLLRRWRTAAPGIALVTRSLDHAGVADQLRRGEVDVALGRFTGRRDGTRAATLYRDEYCVVVRRGHPTIRGSLDRATYLAAGHIIAAAPSEGVPGETLPRDLRITALLPGWLTALTMVAESNAIATCPRRLAAHHAPALGLRVLDLPGRPMALDVSVLTRDDPSPAAAWLADEIRRAIDVPPDVDPSR